MGVALGVNTQVESRHGVSHVPSEGSLRARVPDHHPCRRSVGKRTVAAVAVDGGPNREWRQKKHGRWETVYSCRDGLLVARSASWSALGPGYRSSPLGSGESGIDQGTSWPSTGDNCARSRDGGSSDGRDWRGTWGLVQ